MKAMNPPVERMICSAGVQRGAGVLRTERFNLKTETSPSSAFSLVELLVVVAILAILAAVGSQALGDRKGAKARGGAEVMDALFSLARTQAVMKRTNTRVVVQTGYRSEKPEDFLRAVAVVQDASAPGHAPWTTTTQVTPWKHLPEGAFFSQARSGGDGAMSVTAPGGGALSCVFFGFDARGQRSGHAKVVVEAGSQENGTFTSRGVEGAYGFMVYPMGQRLFLNLQTLSEAPEG